jgi:hypothetical protein
MNKTHEVSVDEVVRSLEQTVNDYIKTLEHVSLEQLLWKPTPVEWSLGQMMMHLIQSAQGMQMANVRRCLATEGWNRGNGAEPASGHSANRVQVEKTAQGEGLFRYGSFPTERIQVPASPQYTPSQPKNKEQLVDGLRETLRQVIEVAPAVGEVREQVLAMSSSSHSKLEGIEANLNANVDLPFNTNAGDFSEQIILQQADTHGVQEATCSEYELSLSLTLRTVAHPRLGGLNAWEWFWLIEMHYRHHLHQQQRLEEAWTYEHA